MRRTFFSLLTSLLLFGCSGGGNNSGTAGKNTNAEDNDFPYQPATFEIGDKGEYSPVTFLKADCLAIAMAFDEELGPNFCEALFGSIDQPPPASREDCIAQGSAIDQQRAEGFCNFIYPFVGYSSDSPIQGPNHYLEMADGTLIAMNIKPPKNYVPGRKYPVILEMSGYDAGSSDNASPSEDFANIVGEPLASGIPGQNGTRDSHGVFYENNYVTITASVRGTGCSSGEFDLFSSISAYDGYQIIEWAAAQPWSNGKVGLFGQSYSGITAVLIAATQPPHLSVLSASAIIGDLYRDITYPGGLSNYGFPLLWTGYIRLQTELFAGILAGLLADNGDRQCLLNQAGKSRTVLQDPILNGLQDWDSNWYRARSVVYNAHNINVPTQILTAFQDEQTGPRGSTNVYDHLDPNIPKRLIMMNGSHLSTNSLVEVIEERKAWLDYWLLGKHNPFVDPAHEKESVKVWLEVTTLHEDGIERKNGYIDSTDFPLPETQWTDFYLHSDGQLDTTPPGDEGHTSYFHGSRRQFYAYQAGVNTLGELTSIHAPDEVIFKSETFDKPVVIAGPGTATLFMKAQPAELTLPLPTDLELMVQLIDEGPDGHLSYLQRGLLRASHRAIDPEQSNYTDEGRIYRPYRPHGGPIPDFLVANQTYELLVEMFPVAHVFRPGHRLVVKIHAPSIDDNDYNYIPKSAPTVATILHDAEHPSSLMLPLIPLEKVDHLGPEFEEPCVSARVRCVKPAF